MDTLALWVTLGTGILLARLAMGNVPFSGNPFGVWGQNLACILYSGRSVRLRLLFFYEIAAQAQLARQSKH